MHRDEKNLKDNRVLTSVAVDDGSGDREEAELEEHGDGEGCESGAISSRLSRITYELYIPLGKSSGCSRSPTNEGMRAWPILRENA